MLLNKVPHRIMCTYIFNSCSGNRAFNPHSVSAVLCPQTYTVQFFLLRNALKASIFVRKQSIFGKKHFAIDKFMHIQFLVSTLGFLPNKFQKMKKDQMEKA